MEAAQEEDAVFLSFRAMIQPAVSVVIATCDRPDLLKEAISSVLSQTFTNFEIVIVDDGVEQRAEETVRSFGDPRIRYIRHNTRKGSSAAKNTAFRAARGTYIAILDDDDAWEPEKLEKQIRSLEEALEPSAFSFTAGREIFDNREGVTQVPEGVGNYYELALRRFSAIIDSALLFERSVLPAVGMYDESLPTHTGADFVIRLASQYKGVGINEPLVVRKLESGHVQMGSDIRNRIRGREIILARYASAFRGRPAYLAKHTEQLAKFYRALGEYGKARRCFGRALMLEPRISRVAHILSMYANGAGYRLFRFVK